MALPTVLIVDDEPDIRELLKITLKKMRIHTIDAEGIAEACQLLKRDTFDLCITDMRLQDGDGIQLIEYIQVHHPELPVAVMTAHGNMELAIQSLKAGAFDFVTKPVNLQILRELVSTALNIPRGPMIEAMASTATELLGRSTVIETLRQTIQKLARSQAPVHITGPSGSGKELVARLIHEKGPRASKPFVPVNCGAIPSELMESEFFGHKKGSFTGAHVDKMGLFQAASGGTLFLDEVADLPLNMQVKLLRAIQEKAVRPVGAEREVPVDARILSACHRDLTQWVVEGRFRKDLLYRINVIELRVPSLDERVEDIPLLVKHILAKLTAGGTGGVPVLSDQAIQALCGYSFPGNVRELENILERALTLCDGKVIAPQDLQLPEEVREASARGDNLPGYLGDLEKEAIKSALDKTHWNKTQAARLLGITLRALRYRLKKLGLE